MPLYVYGCPDCEIELEELRPAWRADEPVECPVCHGLCTREISRFNTRSRSHARGERVSEDGSVVELSVKELFGLCARCDAAMGGIR